MRGVDVVGTTQEDLRARAVPARDMCGVCGERKSDWSCADKERIGGYLYSMHVKAMWVW